MRCSLLLWNPIHYGFQNSPPLGGLLPHVGHVFVPTPIYIKFYTVFPSALTYPMQTLAITFHD